MAATRDIGLLVQALCATDLTNPTYSVQSEATSRRMAWGSAARPLETVTFTATNKGQMCLKAFDGVLDSDILIDFLRPHVNHASRKVYSIRDNLQIHHSKPAKAWLAKHKRAIEVF